MHQVGDVLGERYRIISFLDAGGMQEVYEAEDEVLRRCVALKVPFNASAERRFTRSALASARVNHANAAKTLDYFEWDGRSYLVEEFISGCDLKRFLQQVPKLDPTTAAYFLHHLARGVAAMHHVNVIHRDLKPSNIMIPGALDMGGLKVTDFGIARMAAAEVDDAVEGGQETMSASKTVVGAIPYMAPEVIENKRNSSLASDIWSVGAIGYELLCGEKPFGEGLIVIRNVFKGEMPPISGLVRRKTQFSVLGKEVYEILERCLALDPDARPEADELVRLCGDLCYARVPRETGTIDNYFGRKWGFISASNGDTVFFHVDSLFASKAPAIGTDVWFSRFPGHPRDRAFPVVPMG